MSCYHPLIGIKTYGINCDTGNRKIKILGKADNYTLDDFKNGKYCKDGEPFLIPCGKCIGCRLDYSRRWADRMMLELDSCKKGIFLTLTYNDNSLRGFDYDAVKDSSCIKPNREILVTEYNDDWSIKYATLSKRDSQLFMKRFRRKFENLRIRFYMAGEYGDKNLRPHLHCILFGISLSDISNYFYTDNRGLSKEYFLKPHGFNGLNQPYFISSFIENDIWKNGHVLVTDVSWNTCAYVSRYVTKKLGGRMEEVYWCRNCIKEFSLMSRNEGIGAKYLQEHPDCLDYQEIYLSTPEGGRKIQIPKYYLNKVKEEAPDYYNELLEIRKRCAQDNNLIKLSLTDLGFSDMLESEEWNKKEHIKVLKRADL